MKETLLDLFRVPRDAGRLLIRHWPMLVTVCLLGLSARQGFLWLAVIVSDWWSTLGVLLMPLAPMAMMVSLVVMLRVMRGSLSALEPVSEEASEYRVIATLLLPFLAVYASQGLLREDAWGFVRDASRHEELTTFTSADYSRVFIAQGWFLVALVVIAMVTRKLVIGFELSKRNAGWAGFATYLEALWMVTLGAAFASGIQDMTKWVTTRVAWGWWIDLRNWFYSITGFIGDTIRLVLGAIGTVLNSAGALIVVPVAWLSLGALVYGTQLAEAKPAGEEKPPAQPATKREAALRAVRKRARVAAEGVVEPVTTPVKNTWTALGKIAVAGVGPMVLFCLVFVIAQQASIGIAALTRWLVGPQHFFLAESLLPYHLLAQRVVYFVLMIVLLAAAVNRVVESLLTQRQADEIRRAPAEL